MLDVCWIALRIIGVNHSECKTALEDLMVRRASLAYVRGWTVVGSYAHAYRKSLHRDQRSWEVSCSRDLRRL